MRASCCFVATSVICLLICGCESGRKPTAQQKSDQQSAKSKLPLKTPQDTEAELTSGTEETAKEQAISSPEEFQAVLDTFPADSSIPAILRKCMSTDDETLDQGIDEVETLEEQMAAGKLSAQEVRGLFDAYTKLDYPKPVVGFKPDEAISTVLYLVPREPARQLVPAIKSLYHSASWRQKNAFLVMLSGARSREAAEVFVHCIREHGWPETTYPRVFWDLDRLHDHADVLYPALLMNPPEEDMLYVTELLDQTDRSQVTAESLAPLAPIVRQRIAKAISDAQPYQERPTEWEEPQYASARNVLISNLKIAARMNDADSVVLLDKALSFRDSLVVVEAVNAKLRRDLVVSPEVIETMAANHLTREALFESLRRVEKLEAFPAKWRTWDAFACSEMVGWLNHPAELAAPPAEIEKMKVVQAEADGETYSVYVWRYREEPDSEWLVGISGPYVLKGTPQPIYGPWTFSQFTRWDSATPDQHINAVVEMFEEYAERDQ